MVFLHSHKTRGMTETTGQQETTDNEKLLEELQNVSLYLEQGFKSKRADEEDIRRILAVYFEQNVTTEKFEEFDGKRWLIINDGCSCCTSIGIPI